MILNLREFSLRKRECGVNIHPINMYKINYRINKQNERIFTFKKERTNFIENNTDLYNKTNKSVYNQYPLMGFIIFNLQNNISIITFLEPHPVLNFESM